MRAEAKATGEQCQRMRPGISHADVHDCDPDVNGRGRTKAMLRGDGKMATPLPDIVVDGGLSVETNHSSHGGCVGMPEQIPSTNHADLPKA